MSASRLEEFVGEWIGDEVVAPSPWYPHGGPAIGRASARMAVGGTFLVTDYVEECEGRVILEGHGVYAWEARDVYRMYWFDSSGPGPDSPIEGKWVGDTLTFERSAFAGGRVRYVYTVAVGGAGYNFRIERLNGPQAEWQVLMEGRYRKKP